MRLHPLTWCAVLFVLGCFAWKNLQPTAESEGIGTKYGRPLVYKERAFSHTTLLIHPDRPFGIPNRSVATRLNHSALLVNVLLAVLSAAAAGIVCQRLVRPPQPVACDGPSTSLPSR
jgi:hypothetical protein